MAVKEWIFEGKDGLKLAAKAWLAEGEVKGGVVLLHGHGEHIGRYAHAAEFFNQHGFHVYGFDLRGHGKSEGKRGHAKSNDDLLGDLEMFLREIRLEQEDLPLILYGHSMGGNIALQFILKNPVKEIQKAVVTSPWIRLAFEPPAWKIKLGNFMAGIWPSLTQPSGLDENQLSHIEAVVKAYHDDPLVHNKISAALYREISKAGEWILQNTSRLHMPLFLAHGEADKITSYPATKALAEATGADFISYPDMRHELHNETVQQEHLENILRWMEAH